MLSLLRKGPAATMTTDLVVRERPPLESGVSDLQPIARANEGPLTEYARLTKSLGISNPHIDADLGVERFKAFLRTKDWAIFSLPTVIAYMDEKAKAESAAAAGWHWRPLRAKDDIQGADFGTQARAWGHEITQRQPASDHYRGPHSERQMVSHNGNREAGEVAVPASATPYDKLVPLHALRKVATIEAEFKTPGNPPVAFFVCDYAPAPHIEHPDPFLMAVVDNARLKVGVGRFIIDFWDEPGFGLESQLK